MKYIINHHITFDTESGTLSNGEQNNEVIHLSHPGRRLLLLLIQHHRATVSRNILFQKVWDDYGMISSNNNLNQCVSNIRKSLRKLGVDEEIIVTIPKSGLILKGSIFPQQTTGEMPEYLPPATAADPPGIAQYSLTTASHGKPRYWLTASTLVMLSLLIFVSWRIAPSPSRVEMFLGNAGNCQVKLLDKTANYGNRKMMKEVLIYTEQLNPQCSQDEYLLVMADTFPDSRQQERNRLYFMRCSKIMHTSAERCRGFSSS